MVYVLNCKGSPVMPCSEGKARRLLKEGKAKVVSIDPFTIKLQKCYATATQSISLGIDSGYQEVGFSAITDQKEVLCGELQLLSGISERIKEKKMYRTQRRKSLRYRKPKFNNRKKAKGWLAPSILHKLESHLRLVEKIKAILPITNTTVETGNFDIQQIKNPEIKGKEYQQGEQKGCWNLREYILHRDEHKCQNINCENKAKQKILQVHHLGYWKEDRTDRPSNLITLCNKCHIPKNHNKKGFLYGWKPKLKSFKPETFMSSIRWKIAQLLDAKTTYGYLTKSKRIELELAKTHSNDAFVIAGGTTQTKIKKPIFFEQIRRNNRCLQKFYDAKYIDIRTKKKETGQFLYSGRRCRNKNLSGENLRKYRGEKVSKGRVSIRKTRYKYQSKDMVVYQGKKYVVKGIQNYGAYIKLESIAKPVKARLVSSYLYRKGICGLQMPKK